MDHLEGLSVHLTLCLAPLHVLVHSVPDEGHQGGEECACKCDLRGCVRSCGALAGDAPLPLFLSLAGKGIGG